MAKCIHPAASLTLQCVSVVVVVILTAVLTVILWSRKVLT